MSTTLPSDRERPWETGNPWTAGLLAYLIPGAGHFYQGRYFKGAIYFLCILGTFLGGMQLGDWIVVYHYPQKRTFVGLSYAGQLLVGLPAIPALFQSGRYANQPTNLGSGGYLATDKPLEFHGRLMGGPSMTDRLGTAEGTLQLAVVQRAGGLDVEGEFRGTIDGREQQLKVQGQDRPGSFELGTPIGADSRRVLKIEVVPDPQFQPGLTRLEGYTPRPVYNWFEVPPTPDELQSLHKHLSTYYDLAMVFTWVAGLLNIFAIWDAVQGPAYGFGDEVIVHRPSKKSDEPAPEANPVA